MIHVNKHFSDIDPDEFSIKRVKIKVEPGPTYFRYRVRDAIKEAFPAFNICPIHIYNDSTLIDSTIPCQLLLVHSVTLNARLKSERDREDSAGGVYVLKALLPVGG